MRSIIGLALVLALALLIGPLVISSLLVDQRGVLIAGHVESKDEYIVVHYASWTRRLELVVRYGPPDEPGVAFLKEYVGPTQFDSLKKGDVVQLRYLRRDDLPDFPGLKTLHQMRLIPNVRFADQHALSGLEEIIVANRSIVTSVIFLGLILLLWRLLRIRFFGWAVGACVLVGFAASLLAEFPTSMPRPTNGLRATTGTVKSIERVEWLFRDNHQRGLHADQPIQITAVQFVPEGRTEPVVAVDLIDNGSVPGLKEHTSATVDYESAAPRVAYIHGATRQFARRNLQGVVIEGAASLVAVATLLAAAGILRTAFKKLTRRPT